MNIVLPPFSSYQHRSQFVIVVNWKCPGYQEDGPHHRSPFSVNMAGTEWSTTVKQPISLIESIREWAQPWSSTRRPQAPIRHQNTSTSAKARWRQKMLTSCPISLLPSTPSRTSPTCLQLPHSTSPASASLPSVHLNFSTFSYIRHCYYVNPLLYQHYGWTAFCYCFRYYILFLSFVRLYLSLVFCIVANKSNVQVNTIEDVKDAYHSAKDVPTGPTLNPTRHRSLLKMALGILVMIASQQAILTNAQHAKQVSHMTHLN